jgi:hypothetical protein
LTDDSFVVFERENNVTGSMLLQLLAVLNSNTIVVQGICNRGTDYSQYTCPSLGYVSHLTDSFVTGNTALRVYLIVLLLRYYFATNTFTSLVSSRSTGGDGVLYRGSDKHVTGNMRYYEYNQ